MLEATLKVFLENPVAFILFTALGVIAASIGIRKWR